MSCRVSSERISPRKGGNWDTSLSKDGQAKCSFITDSSHRTMSAAMEALRARQIARRAARSPPSIAKIAASCCAHPSASVLPCASPARRCRLDARTATLWGAQSRHSVACRSANATAEDGVVDIDADAVDSRVPITVRIAVVVMRTVPRRPTSRPPARRALPTVSTAQIRWLSAKSNR